jgi:hypothetical protein
MAERKHYRVDRRNVASGEDLPAEGNYQQGFDDIGRRAEAILEKVRATKFPDKLARANSIFVTDDLGCAERYWRTHDERYLYEVDVVEENVTHRGDMHLVDAIGHELKRAIVSAPDYAKCEKLALKYWSGEMSEDPCKELLLEKVTAVNRLRGLSNLKAYIASQVTRKDWRHVESIEDVIGVAKDSNNED